MYRNLARTVAHQIEDYLHSGYSVIGIVGIDGSPSCGVHRALDFRGFDLIANVPAESLTVEYQNAILRECAVEGEGLFTHELQEALRRRHLDVPYLAHDLFAELEGQASDTSF